MLIELRKVSYLYEPGTAGEVEALRDISLEIAQGEFVGVMGHTGCGKTTLLQLIAGLMTPSSGQLLLAGEDINSRGYDRKKLRSRVGVVFQYPEYQLFAPTVEKDVAFSLKHSGLSAEQIREKVKNVLEEMELSYEELREKSPLSFSGGEKRRVAIAGVLAAEPDILLLDEPTAGLDPVGRQNFLALLHRLHQKGMTILMISHDADCFGELAQRILVLKEGRTVFDGSPREAFGNCEKLAQWKIEASQPGQLSYALAQRGFPVSGTAVRYTELLEELKNALGR